MKKNEPQLPRLAYGRRDAAKILGISVPSLDRICQRGLIMPSRALRKPLFSETELRRFLASTTAEIPLATGGAQ
jgi:hypothetical protein